MTLSPCRTAAMALVHAWGAESSEKGSWPGSHCSKGSCNQIFGKSPLWEGWPNAGARHGDVVELLGLLEAMQNQTPPPASSSCLQGQGCCMTAAASSAGIGIEDTILSSPPAVPGEMTLWKQTMVLNPPDRGSVSLEMGGVSKKSLRAGLKWVDFQRGSWKKALCMRKGLSGAGCSQPWVMLGQAALSQNKGLFKWWQERN